MQMMNSMKTLVHHRKAHQNHPAVYHNTTARILIAKMLSYAANWIVRAVRLNVLGHNCEYRINVKNKSKKIFAKKFTKRTVFLKMPGPILKMLVRRKSYCIEKPHHKIDRLRILIHPNRFKSMIETKPIVFNEILSVKSIALIMIFNFFFGL